MNITIDPMSARLHWNTYKGLEREFLSLADNVHINDKQLSVFSLKTAELLLRTASEIESISKDLYSAVSGMPTSRETYFDSDCIKYLNDKWHIEKRVVYVNCQQVYLDNVENTILTPLKKASVQGACDWKKAYQAVKHDGRVCLEKGNIKNFLKSLGALYILNTYFKGCSDKIQIGDEAATKSFNGPRDSDIFLLKIASLGTATGQNGYNPKRDFYDDCTYLVRPTEISLQAMVDVLTNTNKDMVSELTNLLDSLSANKWKGSKEDLETMISNARMSGARRHSGEFIKAHSAFRYEAELNMKQYDPPRLLAHIQSA